MPYYVETEGAVLVLLSSSGLVDRQRSFILGVIGTQLGQGSPGDNCEGKTKFLACFASILARRASAPTPTMVHLRPMNTTQVKSYAAQSATSRLAPFAISRRGVGHTDVALEILYCGVCHSDLHQARNEWHNHRLSRACPATRSSAA